ncbi:type II toxin-antitoxin system VapB family antitoxin [Actinoplanes sp. CA-054009]
MEELMTEPRFEVDQDALDLAAKYFGTTTPEETINAALREVAARSRRAKAFAELVKIAETGQFDELLVKRRPR